MILLCIHLLPPDTRGCSGTTLPAQLMELHVLPQTPLMIKAQINPVIQPYARSYRSGSSHQFTCELSFMTALAATLANA